MPPVLFPILGYLSGSLPFAVWITRLARGIDVRAAGSGHATTTNTLRQAGFGWGAVVLVLDLAKGFVPIWLALQVMPDNILLAAREVISLGEPGGYIALPGTGALGPMAPGDVVSFGLHSTLPWLIPLTAACIVMGHCWPLFASFRGGMGLACLGGVLLALDPIVFPVALALLLALLFTLRHSARAASITGILLAPLLWLIGRGDQTVWAAASAGLVITLRFLIDWNRKYRELWLDRPSAR
jgi:glycerol-3-phosphate acyltransferase PlsY